MATFPAILNDLICRLFFKVKDSALFMRSTNEKVKINFKHSFFWDIREYLRNDEGDGNENDKKAIGLISKTTTLHVHCAFCKFSFQSLHDYDVKLPNFSERISRFMENVNTGQRSSFSSSKLKHRPLELNSGKIRKHLSDKLNNATMLLITSLSVVFRLIHIITSVICLHIYMMYSAGPVFDE